MINFDLGSASIGGIITLILKGIYDFLFEKRKHTLELKKRYFNKKMDITLSTLHSHQFVLSQGISFLSLVESTLKENIDPSIIKGYVEAIQRLQEQFFDDPRNVDTTITFFYDEEIYQLGEKLTALWKETLIPWSRIIGKTSAPIQLSATDIEDIRLNIKILSEIYGKIKTSIKEGDLPPFSWTLS